jgi:type VI secretion system protein ImpM
MPRGVLTAPFAGFFGKLPTTGDFVARGLPDGFRLKWDPWVARYLAPRLNRRWPEGGLRFRLVSGGRVAAGVILPGADRVGRAFPLSLIIIAATLPDPAGLEPWCDVACTLDPNLGADALWAALEALPVPEGAGLDAPFQIWVRGLPPLTLDPAAPDAAIDQILEA